MIFFYLIVLIFARVAELVDALDLGSSILGCVGSSPTSRTIYIIKGVIW